MMDAKEYLKRMSAELDGPIKSYIGDEEPDNLMEASRQYPYMGGKRMRPAMAVACCGAVNGDKSKAVPLAVAIEYIHNFTLIHDDLMDGDSERRGKPTIHIGYGMPTAVLAGDALFAKAFQIICSLDVPAERMREVLEYVSQSVWDLARGQQMDVNNEGQIVTEDVYLETIKLKTSVLFAAAAAGGAIIGGADKATVEAIHEYAIETGLGFQIFDDYLGIMGDPAKTGKSNCNDIRKGKCTVIVTHTIDALKDDPAKLAEFKEILGNMDASEDECMRAKQIMIDAGSIDYAMDMARQKVDRAIECISCLPEGEDKEFMVALARYSIDREL